VNVMRLRRKEQDWGGRNKIGAVGTRLGWKERDWGGNNEIGVGEE
jgi:hypothetical protein